MAELGLTITGTAGSDVKVNWRVEVVVKLPSVTVKVTAKLPSTVGIPVMRPVTGSASRPAGRPLAVKRAARLPPVVATRKLNTRPVLPPAAVLLMNAGPGEGGGCTVIVSVALVVPPAFMALSPVEKVPGVVGLPTIERREVLNARPGGGLETPSEVAPIAWNS